ncbi:hypothetical protein BH11MYX1_BH11MYX1_28280 [soil metagenome]
MRFCPFCSAENADDLAVCQACGRRLPPLPPRRGATRNAPPTGIQLPNRPAGSTLPPRKPPSIVSTQPYLALPDDAAAARSPEPLATTVEATTWDGEDSLAQPPQSSSPPVLPTPIPGVGPTTGTPVSRATSPSLADDSARRELANALNPGPAAQRREASPDDRIPADRRTRADSKQPLSPTSLMRPNSPSQPPPLSVPAMRSPSPSQPPPLANPPPSAPPSGEADLTAPPRTTGQLSAPRASQPPMTPPAFGAPARRPPTAPPPIPKSGGFLVGRSPTPSPFGGDTFITDNDYTKSQIEPTLERGPNEPPPTRIRTDAMVEQPFAPPQVIAIPLVPEPGLVKAAKYAYVFARARWQRRGAIRLLGQEIKQDTEALDQVLGALGLAARNARVEGRVFSAENSAISDAQERINQLETESAEVEGRKAEELSKFIDIERERNAKLTEAERMVGEAQSELSNLEAQRRSLRDKRKELERRLKAYLKAAEDHDRQAGTSPLGDQRQELRRVAEGHRKEAVALEPDKQELNRRLGGIERPINEVAARLDAGKAELDAAKRSLNDAREGHTHRLAELESEQKRKTREIGLAQAEISRRLVTLGTLVNLNRIEDPQFAELYSRIDRLRSAITSRTTEQERLTAEREAYDRGTLVRGVAAIGGAILILITLIVIVAAIL